jgi:B-cell receptor-associated protein 31
LFRFFGTSPIVGKILYGVKISIIFVTILLVDAVQRLFRVMADRSAAKDQLGVRDNAHGDLLLKLAFAQ